MDAYHLAYAENKHIDYFITVDKQMAVTVRDFKKIRRDCFKALKEKEELQKFQTRLEFLYLIIFFILFFFFIFSYNLFYLSD